jgi:putative RNA 2'-phosphotransferase
MPQKWGFCSRTFIDVFGAEYMLGIYEQLKIETMNKKLVRTSKFLSLVLRHKPDTIGLSLNENGWVSIQDLIDAANANDHNISREMLDEVVFTNDKQRFSYNHDGQMIRANQGHSVQINLELESIDPPDILYHGTVERFLNSIIASGLQKMKRQHVHLSATIETAKNVGKRRGEPVVLSVNSGAMNRDGHRFFLSQNGVWHTDSVPWKYVTILNNI